MVENDCKKLLAKEFVNEVINEVVAKEHYSDTDIFMAVGSELAKRDFSDEELVVIGSELSSSFEDS